MRGKIKKGVRPTWIIEMPPASNNTGERAVENSSKDARKHAIKDAGKDAKKIAEILLRATALSDAQIFPERNEPRYTTVDYYRMACHLLFSCQRCGNCCTTGDPIRLRPDDAAALARHLKIPLNKALKKYTVADSIKPGVLKFKHILPCKFYDAGIKGCKIYEARPWSCRIFPFLGIYGDESRVIVNQSCPGSIETMKILTESLEGLRAQDTVPEVECQESDLSDIKEAKRILREALNLI